MMKLVMAFYEQCTEALKQGSSIDDLLKMAVRARIGRYKYTPNENIEKEYEAVTAELAAEIAESVGKEDF